MKGEDQERQAVVIGAGAAGYFGAITCAEKLPPGEGRVLLLEKSGKTLSKVKISGGGRCNVTHACFEPKELIGNYPRGGKNLLGAFYQWQPRDTVDWFENRGVDIKMEGDGRMFPRTDDSATIVNCLETAARDAGVEVRTKTVVETVRVIENGFRLELKDGDTLTCRRLLLATGGGRGSGGSRFAAELGHRVIDPVPSLFTFHVDDARLRDLAGVSVGDVEARATGFDTATRGPLLITHWGLSGPAILKLSAWGARFFHAHDYRFTLRINWLPELHQEQLRDHLRGLRQSQAKKLVKNTPPPGLTQRLWQRLAAHAGIGESRRWNALPKTELNRLVETLGDSRFAVTGKSTFKEEFVTCGGVDLREIDLRTMQSRRVPNLYFAGELLDIDGVTGGFNFQAAWTTGRIAGLAMGRDKE